MNDDTMQLALIGLLKLFGIAAHKDEVGSSAYAADGIVPLDEPFLDFYRWHWKFGDGWNADAATLERTLPIALETLRKV